MKISGVQFVGEIVIPFCLNCSNPPSSCQALISLTTRAASGKQLASLLHRPERTSVTLAPMTEMTQYEEHGRTCQRPFSILQFSWSHNVRTELIYILSEQQTGGSTTWELFIPTFAPWIWESWPHNSSSFYGNPPTTSPTFLSDIYANPQSETSGHHSFFGLE
jgi:hypothetical protein